MINITITHRLELSPETVRALRELSDIFRARNDAGSETAPCLPGGARAGDGATSPAAAKAPPPASFWEGKETHPHLNAVPIMRSDLLSLLNRYGWKDFFREDIDLQAINDRRVHIGEMPFLLVREGSLA